MQQWSKVAFADESSFALRPMKSYVRVWRREGSRYETANMIHTFKPGFMSISVWGPFAVRGSTPLVLIVGTLNQQKYIEILKSYVLPFKNAYHSESNDFIYQHDGCVSHRAKSVSLFLKQNNVYVLPRSAQSPDLNPIENVWSIMKNRLRVQHTYPSTPDALFKELNKIWNELPNMYSTTLISSMMTPCDARANVRGKSTKY